MTINDTLTDACSRLDALALYLRAERPTLAAELDAVAAMLVAAAREGAR
jgi:hypothetical protein